MTAELTDLAADLAPSLTQTYRAPKGDLTRLRGDASTRIYYRYIAANPAADEPKTLIVMRLPEDATKSDEATSGAAPTELPFLNMHRFLHARGVPVPRIFASDLPRRVVLLEDLSDETFEARLLSRGPAQTIPLYEHAIDLLADMHAKCAAPDPACMAFSRGFDEKLLRWELEHFLEWGLEALHGPLPPDKREPIGRLFDALAKELAEATPHFVHRDFQSRNLMWQGDRLVVIDFQDALMGPAPYDLVALLCDSYVSLTAEQQQHLLMRYAAARNLNAADTAAFKRLFYRIAVQRKLKDAGRFVFIDRVRKNPDFLRWYPQSLVYVARALEANPDLAPVAKVLAELLPGYPDRIPVPAAVSPSTTRE